MSSGKNKIVERPSVYQTSDVAKLLGIPEWRVIRIAERHEHGITPAFGDAAGSGSRRLYDEENVAELAVTSWLVDSGLDRRVIGQTLRKLREERTLRAVLAMEKEKLLQQELIIVHEPKRKWFITSFAAHLTDLGELHAILDENPNSTVFLIPLGRRLAKLARRIRKNRR